MAKGGPLRTIRLDYRDWTPLERATQRRYERCQARGGHRWGGETVRRRRGPSDTTLPVCADCAVPVDWEDLKQGRGRRSPHASAEGRLSDGPAPRPVDEDELLDEDAL
jgi:hypothetical protein